MSRRRWWTRALATAAAAALFLPWPAFSAAPPGGAETTPIIDRYRRALDADPDNLTLHYHFGVALLVDGKNREAITEFRRAYSAFSDSAEMNYNLGLAYLRLGNADNALFYLDQAETLGALEEPEVIPMANAFYNLGLLYLDAGEGEEATALFRRVLAIAPERREIHRMLGEVYARNRQTEKALAQFARYLEAYPDDQQVQEYVFTLHYNEALKALERNDLDQAGAFFEKALAFSPDSPPALYYLGYVDYALGRLQAASARLSGVYRDLPEDLRPNARSILYNTALALLEKGEAAAASLAIAPLLDGDDADLKALYLAGNIRLVLEDFNEARRLYERVLVLDAGHQGALLKLAAAEKGAVAQLVAEGRELYRRGEYRQALELLQEALTIDPAHDLGRAYLEETRRELSSRAGELFARAEDLLAAGKAAQALPQIRLGLSCGSDSPRGNALLAQALKMAQKEIGRELDRARRFLAEGDFVQAEASFRRVLEFDPDQEAAREGLAMAASRRAEAADRQAARGRQLLEEGRLAEAREAFRSALQSREDHAEARAGLNRAEALAASLVAEELRWARRAISQGRPEEAREHFRNALAFQDDKPVRREQAAAEEAFAAKARDLTAAAEAALRQGKFKKSGDLYRQALLFQPAAPSALQGLKHLQAAAAEAVNAALAEAQKARAAGNLLESLNLYRRVLAIDPANAQALAGLKEERSGLEKDIGQLVRQGLEALAAGRQEEARSYLQRARNLDPRHPGVREAWQRLRGEGPVPENGSEDYYLQGIDLYTQGHYEEAVAAWEKVSQTSARYENARRNMEKARRKLQQIRERRGG